MQLGSPSRTSVGTQYIVVGRDAGWFRTLRFEVTSGSVNIRHVRVLSDRRFQTFAVNRRLDGRHPIAYVDLGVARRIENLAVTTDRFPRGSYVVHGSSGGIPAPFPHVAQR